MVLESPFPPDIRVEKEIRALKGGGHQVTLLCGHKQGQPNEDSFEGSQIVRFSVGPAENKLSKASDIFFYWRTMRKRAWQVAIEKFLHDHNIEALHVHDLPLVPTGIWAARRAGIPIIFDMHEVYPVMIRTRAPLKTTLLKQFNSFIHSLMFSPSWWDRVERFSVEQADRVIVVVEESKQRLLRMGINDNKVSVVLNAEDIDSFLALPEVKATDFDHRNDFLVGYVGGVDSANRGLGNLVRAWPLLLQRVPNARLLIVGDGVLRPSIEELVQSLNLSGKVSFTGWVPFEAVATYVRGLNVAVIPHVIDEHTNHTVPHKLFQYIALGKLVVASDIVPIRRILQDTGAGIIVDDWSPQGFANAIARAHDVLQTGTHDPRHQLSVLKSKYSFRAVSEPLLNLYESLQENHAS